MQQILSMAHILIHYYHKKTKDLRICFINSSQSPFHLVEGTILVFNPKNNHNLLVHHCSSCFTLLALQRFKLLKTPLNCSSLNYYLLLCFDAWYSRLIGLTRTSKGSISLSGKSPNSIQKYIKCLKHVFK